MLQRIYPLTSGTHWRVGGGVGFCLVHVGHPKKNVSLTVILVAPMLLVLRCFTVLTEVFELASVPPGECQIGYFKYRSWQEASHPSPTVIAKRKAVKANSKVIILA